MTASERWHRVVMHSKHVQWCFRWERTWLHVGRQYALDNGVPLAYSEPHVVCPDVTPTVPKCHTKG